MEVVYLNLYVVCSTSPLVGTVSLSIAKPARMSGYGWVTWTPITGNQHTNLAGPFLSPNTTVRWNWRTRHLHRPRLRLSLSDRTRIVADAGGYHGHQHHRHRPCSRRPMPADGLLSVK